MGAEAGPSCRPFGSPPEAGPPGADAQGRRRRPTGPSSPLPAPLCSGSAGCESALSGRRRDAGATGHQERAGELPAACPRNRG